MNKYLSVFFISTVLIFIPKVSLYAQEYKYEIGGGVGGSFYMGDANKTKLFLNTKPAMSLMHRYNINLNWAVKSNFVVGKVSGSTLDSKNVFPNAAEASFERAFFELGSQIELNLIPYSDKFDYLNTKKYTPYLLVGLGLTMGTGDAVFVNANLPIGIGFKYKLKERMNIGAEFSMRKLFGDNFDVVEKSDNWNLDSPFGVKSSFFKNKDWYSLVTIFFTWEFGEKFRLCCGDN